MPLLSISPSPSSGTTGAAAAELQSSTIFSHADLGFTTENTFVV
jgi:hypothetical protein